MSRVFARIDTTIVIMMVLAVAAFFMASVELPPWSHFISAPAIIFFALPSFWGARRWLGWRDAAVLFTILGVFALVIESIAVMTGMPYGNFEYTNHLGYKLFGLVPWTVAVAWTPLLLGAYSVGAKLTRSRGSRMIVVCCLLVIFDLVLDPGAVRFGFWKYEAGGVYYGVPISNFAGWLISGLAGSALMEFLVGRFKPLLPVPVQLASSSILIVYFWTCIAAVTGLMAPTAIGAIVLLGLATFWRRHYFAFDDMIVTVDDDNNPIGTARKLDAHDSKTHLHRAFSVFVFNRRGELLLQQRAHSKKTWPGVWSNSCCGHPMLHESVESAAGRRLGYELGLNGIQLAMMLPDFRYRAEKDGIVENELCPVLVGVTDGVPNPNALEVATIKWIAWSDFLESVSNADYEVSPWAMQEAHLLEECDQFRQWFDREISPAPR